MEQQTTKPLEVEVDAVVIAFEGLPAAWRSILWQLEVEEATVEEVAERMDLEPGDVRTLAGHIRRAFRADFREALRTIADQAAGGHPATKRPHAS